MTERAAAAAQNDNLSKTTGMDSKTTGVCRTTNSFNLQYRIEDDSGDDNVPPKMEVDYDSDDSDNSNGEPYDPPVLGMPPLMRRN